MPIVVTWWRFPLPRVLAGADAAGATGAVAATASSTGAGAGARLGDPLAVAELAATLESGEPGPGLAKLALLGGAAGALRAAGYSRTKRASMAESRVSIASRSPIGRTWSMR